MTRYDQRPQMKALPPPSHYEVRRPRRAPSQVRPQHPVYTYKKSGLLRIATYGVATLLVGTLLVAAYSGLWQLMAELASGQVEDFFTARQAAGMTARYESLDVSGYPGPVVVTAENPVLAAPDAAWSVESDRFRLIVAPWTPFTGTVDLAGQHRVTHDRIGPDTLPVTVAAGTASFDLYADPWPDEAEVSLSGLATPHFSLDSLQAVARRLAPGRPDHKHPTFHLDLAAEGIDGPQLFQAIASVDLEAEILGRIPGGPLPAALDDWRDRGGSLALTRLAVAQQRTRLETRGTLSLDDGRAPTGDLIAKVWGFNELIETFKSAGALRSSEATLARLLLGPFLREDENGLPVLGVPVRIQDQALFTSLTGSVPLLSVPPIDWAGMGRALDFLQQGAPPPAAESAAAPGPREAEG